MGFPPPPDAPSLDAQASASEAATFAPSPPGEDLCGFALPVPSLPFPAFSLPSLGDLIAFPPAFSFPLPSLRCDADEPFSAGPGGGRTGTPGLTDDPEFGPDEG